MPADLSSIMKLEVPLIVVIGARLMPVKDVMNLAPGAIVELPNSICVRALVKMRSRRRTMRRTADHSR